MFRLVLSSRLTRHTVRCCLFVKSVLCPTNARISYKQSSALRIKISSNNALRTLSAISCRKWTHHWIVCCVRCVAMCAYHRSNSTIMGCKCMHSPFHTSISNDPHDLTSVVSRSSRLGVWTDMVTLQTSNNSGANDNKKTRFCSVSLCSTDPTLGVWRVACG
jgi:hypothetical protein